MITCDSKHFFLQFIFTGNLRDQKEKGLDKSRRRPPLSQTHVKQIYNNYFIPHYDNDPRCLQHKVYFDIAYFLGKIAKEGLRALTKDSFSIKTNDEGREYLELSYNEATKKSQGDDNYEMNNQPIILSQTENAKCPVKSYKLYVSKLTDLKAFFQKPNPYFKKITDPWYHKSPVGENTIGEFMKNISKNAGLSIIYTNHCVRGTTATAMHRSGYSLHDIAAVTKHKNIESLKFYLEQPTLDDMQNYSESLFQYTDKNKSAKVLENKENNESDDDFEPNPPRQKKKFKSSATTTTQLNTENSQLVPLSPKFDNNHTGENQLNPLQHMQNNTQNTTSNIMCMYRQNPVGMFVGANLNNCTINTNMPK